MSIEDVVRRALGHAARGERELPVVLAIREEDPEVNAYVAPPGTLAGAVRIAAVSLRACRADPRILEDFKALAMRVFAAHARAHYGVEVSALREERITVPSDNVP